MKFPTRTGEFNEKTILFYNYIFLNVGLLKCQNNALATR